ncbi:hypothetical protein OG372_12650 [Streptomyces sp. NBC_01020]|uniref:hypothetical protein n=1 Tax=Streptomyces sp. NBC_01020 TaxID=2903722 RepID=UPI003865E3A1|nr:hypothetical protein OG372_12650 [Streptomyces sp. NBC_01020]
MGESETAAELKKRAETLRSAARRARTAAHGLGSYLDNEVKQAAGSGKDRITIWEGPYAELTTAKLQAHSRTLHTMASDLVADARRWDSEARNLDERANHAAKHKSGH